MERPLVAPAPQNGNVAAGDNTSNESRRSRWFQFIVLTISACIIVLVLLVMLVAFMSLLHARDSAIPSLSSSLDRANFAIRYHACCTGYSATIRATHLTRIATQDPYAGYMISLWNQTDQKTSVQFYSETLQLQRTCHVDHVDANEEVWMSHWFFPVADEEAIFYSYPSLFFVRKRDCEKRSIKFGEDLVGSVLPIGKAGEFLVAYGTGTVNIGLVNSDRKLVWSKKIDGPNTYTFAGNSGMIRLKNGRYALTYYTNYGSPLQKSSASVGTMSTFCIATIEIAASHPTADSVQFKKVCGQGLMQSFGLIETGTGTILSLGVDSAWDLVVFEVHPTTLVARVNLVLKETTGFFYNYGSAYRASATRYAFSAGTRQTQDQDTYAEAIIYDYPSNRVVNSATLELETYLQSPTIGSTLFGGGNTWNAVFTVGVHGGFAALPVGRGNVIKRGNVSGEFWHMAATSDGGYVVHSGGETMEKKVWKFYPWQNEREDCTDVL